ncbi:MAG: DUF6084 family protein [Solirubrobacterales bacterium]
MSGANGANGAAPVAPDRPDPAFEVRGVRVPRHPLAPELAFEVGVSDTSGLQVLTISLAVQIAIEPSGVRYDEETRERLVELLGEPARTGALGAPTRTIPWKRVDVLVQPFRGETTVEVPVPCDYDAEVAATAYFSALPRGRVPLVFHFNGSAYYEGEDGRLQIVQLSWEESPTFRMPVDAWREAIAAHYPHRRWLAADEDTVERLRRYKLEHGLPSYEAALEHLLDGAVSPLFGNAEQRRHGVPR